MGDGVTVIDLDDQVTMPIAVEQLPVITGAQGLGDLLEEELEENTAVGSLLIDMDVDGEPKAIRWTITTKDAGATAKFETCRLFPEAATSDTRCKLTSFGYNGASFNFRPNCWTSDWVVASSLKVSFLKGVRGGAAAGAYTQQEVEKFSGRFDFLIRASIELTGEIEKAKLVFSAIPTGQDSLVDLPGYISPGINYPCVSLTR